MSVEKVRLLGLRISVYTRIVRLVLEEKIIPYEFEEVDVFAEGGPPEEYLARHPFGMIPCLLHENFCLYETTAISHYIDEAFQGPSLLPSDTQTRARMNQIISILDSYAYRRMVWDVYVERISVPTEGGQPDEQLIAGALPVISKVLEQLEIYLGNSDYLVGSNLSLADCHALPMLLYFVETPEGKEMFATYPRLQRWMETMQSRNSVQATGFETVGDD
jgi:glutathione S-transferase